MISVGSVEVCEKLVTGVDEELLGAARLSARADATSEELLLFLEAAALRFAPRFPEK